MNNTVLTALWTKIGNVFANKQEVVSALAAKQGTLTAGRNIAIDQTTGVIDCTLGDSADEEQVLINVSSSVQGIDPGGLVINVYYNNSDVLGDTVTTDANGSAELIVPWGTRYKLVFPTLSDCKEVLPVTHVAAVNQRSVEVEYEEAIEGQYEQVTVVLKNSSGGNVSGATVTYTIGNSTESVVTDSNGEASFQVEIGTTYTVTAPTREGYFISDNVYSKTQEADRAQRTYLWIYKVFTAGIGIITTDGRAFDSLEDFKEAVDLGDYQKSDAYLIRVMTSTLQSNGGSFSMKISTIATDPLVTKKWASSTSYIFTSIPNDGQYTNTNYHYDGKTASELIQQEGDNTQPVVDTPAVDYCLDDQQAITIGGQTYKGFLLAYGQMNALWSARDTIDNIINYLDQSWRTLALINTCKWTSTQQGANLAWGWTTIATVYSGANRGKVDFYVVLPAYAYLGSSSQNS